MPIERTIRRLADRYDRLQVCFEAGPMGYGLYRQVEALGHDCMVVAQALIPKRSGEHKTNRRDAIKLARLQRPGELTLMALRLYHPPHIGELADRGTRASKIQPLIPK